MNRRTFVTGLGALLAAPPAVEAQQARGTPKIGILTIARDGDAQVVRNFAALREGLRERGGFDGQNILFEYRWADGKYERLRELAADLVRVKVDVIVGATTPLIRAVREASDTIPIVMVAIFDPVGAGFVKSLARPGGNITGLTFISGLQIVGKQLALLTDAAPGTSHVALLRNPANAAHDPLLTEAEATARTLQMRLQPFAATDPNELDGVFIAMTAARVRALLVLADAAFYTHRERIVQLAAKSGLPAMYGSLEFTTAGGLMAYGANIRDQWNRAATYVDKILRGAKVAELPVEQPTRFELVINLKTAKTLGLTIPPSVLLRADQVIE